MSPLKPACVAPVETSERQIVDPDTQVVKEDTGKEISDYKKSHSDCGMCLD